jgi:dihydrofolate reductase
MLPPVKVALPPAGVGIIVATASNGVIGRSGQLPWRIPEDFEWFKANVRGDVLVYGRRCYEETGRAIPGVHHTIVVSRGNGPLASYPDAEVAVGLPGAHHSLLTSELSLAC